MARGPGSFPGGRLAGSMYQDVSWPQNAPQGHGHARLCRTATAPGTPGLVAGRSARTVARWAKASAMAAPLPVPHQGGGEKKKRNGHNGGRPGSGLWAPRPRRVDGRAPSRGGEVWASWHLAFGLRGQAGGPAGARSHTGLFSTSLVTQIWATAPDCFSKKARPLCLTD